MKKLSLVLFGSCLMLTTGVYGQFQVPHPLSDNTDKMIVTIKLDRDVYFLDEFYKATIEVINPTNAPLVVEAPFQEAGCVSAVRKEGDKLIPTEDPRMGGGCRDYGPAPAITLAPGERTHAVLDTLGFDGRGWPSLRAGHGMLYAPGDYVLRYDYGAGAQVEFAVVAPKLEAAVAARVKDIMYSDQPDQKDPHPLRAYVQVVSFRWQDQSYICVSQGIVTNLKRNPTLKPGEPYAPGLTAFKRIATIQDRVIDLSATADSDENLTIEWTTSSGRQEKSYYSASYVIRDAYERDRKLMLEKLEDK